MLCKEQVPIYFQYDFKYCATFQNRKIVGYPARFAQFLVGFLIIYRAWIVVIDTALNFLLKNQVGTGTTIHLGRLISLPGWSPTYLMVKTINELRESVCGKPAGEFPYPCPTEKVSDSADNIGVAKPYWLPRK